MIAGAQLRYKLQRRIGYSTGSVDTACTVIANMQHGAGAGV